MEPKSADTKGVNTEANTVSNDIVSDQRAGVAGITQTNTNPGNPEEPGDDIEVTDVMAIPSRV